MFSFGVCDWQEISNGKDMYLNMFFNKLNLIALNIANNSEEFSIMQ